jgi:hypothetical protein
MVERRVEQPEGTDDIGVDEGLGIVDRAVDMAFGREVHDDVDGFGGEKFEDCRLVADVALNEAIVRRIADLPQGIEIARISKLVEIDDPVAAAAHQMAAERRTDEAGAAGDQDVQSLIHREFRRGRPNRPGPRRRAA